MADRAGHVMDSGVPTHERKVAAEAIAGGSSGEAIAGAGAAVLAILALLGVLPGLLTEISAIAIGGGLLLLGAAAAARYQRLSGEMGDVAFTGGVGAEFAGGLFGLALGILALLGVAPLTLLEVAVIVFGGSLLIGSVSTVELGFIPRDASAKTSEAVRASIVAASGAQILIGMGAIALGILALIGVSGLTLTQVGLIGVGVALLLSGSTVAARMAKAFL